jgi:GT2 family glycosyltransferase
MPTRIIDIDLLLPLPAMPEMRPHEALMAIVRVGPAPVGRLLAPRGKVGEVVAELARHLATAVSPARFGEACRRVGRAEKAPAELPLDEIVDVFRAERRMAGDGARRPTVSVVVCTRRRRDHLVRCLESLLHLTYSAEVILVDNNEPGESVFDVAGRFPCTYVKSMKPGVSRSRNRALAEARGEIVAFTHDDAEVDPGWVEGLVRAFDDPRVQAVTGPVLPRELITRGQEWFDELGWTHPCWYQQVVFEPGDLDPGLTPGAGANMAFRKEFLVSRGGFDELLGSGTPTGGGDDTEAFLAVLQSGGRVVYTPEAVVRHRHRIDMEEARAAAFQRSSARTAVLARLVHRDPNLLRPILRDLMWHTMGRHATPLADNVCGARANLAFPLRALAAMYGPLSYVQSLWDARARKTEEDEGTA